MLSIPIASALALALLTAGFDSPAPPKTNLYRQGTRSAVLLHPRVGYGSGVVFRRVDPSGVTRWFAWTAAHVVSEVDRLDVDGIKAKVLARNEDLDVALVSLDTSPDRASAKFSFDVPELGQEIFVVGSPYGPGYRNRIFFGRVSGVDERLAIENWRWGKCDLFSGSVYPGNSGGPVFDEHGKVLGLIVGRSDVVSLYVPFRSITLWVEKANLRWALIGDSCPAPMGEFDVAPIDVN